MSGLGGAGFWHMLASWVLLSSPSQAPLPWLGVRDPHRQVAGREAFEAAGLCDKCWPQTPEGPALCGEFQPTSQDEWGISMSSSVSQAL